MSLGIEMIFERVCGPLKRVSKRLAVGRCPSCNTDDSLFIDLKTGAWRCGRLPDSFLDAAITRADELGERKEHEG